MTNGRNLGTLYKQNRGTSDRKLFYLAFVGNVKKLVSSNADIKKPPSNLYTGFLLVSGQVPWQSVRLV